MKGSVDIKLFGECKRVGECICMGCEDAPINRRDAITIRKPDGSVSEMDAPAGIVIGEPTRDFIGNLVKDEDDETKIEIKTDPVAIAECSRCTEKYASDRNHVCKDLANCYPCKARGELCFVHGGKPDVIKLERCQVCGKTYRSDSVHDCPIVSFKPTPGRIPPGPPARVKAPKYPAGNRYQSEKIAGVTQVMPEDDRRSFDIQIEEIRDTDHAKKIIEGAVSAAVTEEKPVETPIPVPSAIIVPPVASIDPELTAMGALLEALRPLSTKARERVIAYAEDRLKADDATV